MQLNDEPNPWAVVLDRQQAELAADEKRYASKCAFLAQLEAQDPGQAPHCTMIREASGRLLDKRRIALAAAQAEYLDHLHTPSVTLN
jgi:hypothetical protein